MQEIYFYNKLVKYYLIHEKECFIIFKTRGAAERFRYDKTTDLNYWIKLLSCIIEANGGHIGLSHINLHWYY